MIRIAPSGKAEGPDRVARPLQDTPFSSKSPQRNGALSHEEHVRVRRQRPEIGGHDPLELVAGFADLIHHGDEDVADVLRVLGGPSEVLRLRLLQLTELGVNKMPDVNFIMLKGFCDQPTGTA